MPVPRPRSTIAVAVLISVLVSNSAWAQFDSAACADEAQRLVIELQASERNLANIEDALRVEVQYLVSVLHGFRGRLGDFTEVELKAGSSLDRYADLEKARWRARRRSNAARRLIRQLESGCDEDLQELIRVGEVDLEQRSYPDDDVFVHLWEPDMEDDAGLVLVLELPTEDPAPEDGGIAEAIEFVEDQLEDLREPDDEDDVDFGELDEGWGETDEDELDEDELSEDEFGGSAGDVAAAPLFSAGKHAVTYDSNSWVCERANYQPQRTELGPMPGMPNTIDLAITPTGALRIHDNAPFSPMNGLWIDIETPGPFGSAFVATGNQPIGVPVETNFFEASLDATLAASGEITGKLEIKFPLFAASGCTVSADIRISAQLAE